MARSVDTCWFQSGTTKKNTIVFSRFVNRERSSLVTQYTVHSFVLSVSDPMGLFAPKHVRFLEAKWRVLPDDIEEKTFVWLSYLPKLEQMTILCTCFISPVDRAELYLFGDSSKLVFRAVVFLRGRIKDSPETEVLFVSLKELECSHALLAARLRVDICKAVTFPVLETSRTQTAQMT